MPLANLGNVNEGGDFPLIPLGQYKCTVDSIEEGVSGNNNKTWKLQLGIYEGEYEGSKIFDCLTWTPAAFSRIKNFFRACGRDVDKDEEVAYVESMAKDKKLWVSVHVEDDPTYGEKTKVDFYGYAALADEGETPSESGDSEVGPQEAAGEIPLGPDGKPIF